MPFYKSKRSESKKRNYNSRLSNLAGSDENDASTSSPSATTSQGLLETDEHLSELATSILKKRRSADQNTATFVQLGRLEEPEHSTPLTIQRRKLTTMEPAP
uniref:Uncharacterized protein n=1 Tax=Meloidogyne javanica TaxID=6303 RepID=A0A915LSS9_MELJA